MKDEAQVLLNSYYEENPKADGDRTKEADEVSLQIAKILSLLMYEKYGNDNIFGRSDVEELTGLKSTKVCF